MDFPPFSVCPHNLIYLGLSLSNIRSQLSTNDTSDLDPYHDLDLSSPDVVKEARQNLAHTYTSVFNAPIQEHSVWQESGSIVHPPPNFNLLDPSKTKPQKPQLPNLSTIKKTSEKKSVEKKSSEKKKKETKDNSGPKEQKLAKPTQAQPQQATTKQPRVKKSASSSSSVTDDLDYVDSDDDGGDDDLIKRKPKPKKKKSKPVSSSSSSNGGHGESGDTEREKTYRAYRSETYSGTSIPFYRFA
jgi:hypothetical protein